MIHRFVVIVVASIWLSQTLVAVQQPSPEDDTQLPRLPALSIEDAAASLEIGKGLSVKLVASEPLVNDPVAFCFDAWQRLWVVEMRGYSERREDGIGRIRRLEDHDGDGVMDDSIVIIDDLMWPTAIECYRDGVIVATAPDLLYVERASENEPAKVEKLCSGFGLGNVQGLVNSLRWGLDLRLHGATSSSGATIVGLGHDPQQPLVLGQRDFVIDMDRRLLNPADGGGQHGMMIDAWGDKYVCSNSDHLQQVMMVPGRDNRASRYSSEPRKRRSIAVDGPQAEVYRASPVEPWRILRTRLRVSGQVPGMIEGGGRAAGYFTGATGVWVYEGDCFGSGEPPVALVCDVGSNLIHRKQLTPNGLFNLGSRIDQQTELLRSRDTWFRPVQLASGPDGGIYIADMTREVIEHPKSLPPVIKSQVDLNSGNEMGRIWKIVNASETLQKAPILAGKTAADLALLVDTRNAWQRRTAARLLAEQHGIDGIDELGRVASGGIHPEGRLQALATLIYLWQRAVQQADGIDDNLHNTIRDSISTAISTSLADSHPRVRQRAIEFAASLAQRGENWNLELLQPLANDKSIHVRFQLAHDASTLIADKTERLKLLLRIAAQDWDDEWIRWAVEGSLNDDAVGFLTQLINAESFAADVSSSTRQAWFNSICFQAVDDKRCHDRLVAILTKPTKDRDALVAAVARSITGTPPGNSPVLQGWVSENVVEQLKVQVEQETNLNSELIASMMQLVRWGAPETANVMLIDLLGPQNATVLQRLAIANLTGFDKTGSEILAQQLSGLSPIVGEIACQKLAQSKFGGKVLRKAVEAGQVSLNILPLDIRQQWFKDIAVKDETARATMAEVLARFRPGLDGPADIETGRQMFSTLCASCHQVGGIGHSIGPDLKSIVEKTDEQILLSIVDPNAEVDPKYLATQVVTIYGQVISGVVVAESEGRIVLGDNQGTSHEIRRDQIESLNRSSVSLMPEGLHEQIPVEKIASLMMFLRRQGE